MKVVISAGGKGTRISSLISDIPKPMIKIGDMPVLEREIYCLRDQGLKDIIITVGHLGNIIMEYFGDGKKNSPVTKKPFGVNITYYYEQEPLGTAGALFKIKDQLKDDFLLLNGDVVFDVDFNRFIEFHNAHGGVATLLTHPNSHPYDSGLIITNEADHSIDKWLSKEDDRPRYYKNRVNAGMHILSPNLLNQRFDDQKIDLDRQILKPLAGTGKMFAYDSPEYVKDMGTPERYYLVQQNFQDGIISSKSLRCKQKAIFLDRDGTINTHVGFLKNIEDFNLIDGVAEAVKRINESGFLAIVVTNQPVIARGELTVGELGEIHNKMETLLGNDGAYLDSIYYCPHHPDRGYPNEISELKIDCDCRKPKPGLLLRAARDFNIDLEKSWMIGDSRNDILAGINAGCHTVLISSSNEDFGQTLSSNDILRGVINVLEQKNE